MIQKYDCDLNIQAQKKPARNWLVPGFITEDFFFLDNVFIP